MAGGALLSDAVPKFVVGAVVGGIEFGASGFGAGFGASIGSGESFKDAARIGLVTAGVSAIAGAIIEGSYMAGWQSSMHGATVGDLLREKGVEREVALYRGYSDILTAEDAHEGVEIADNYQEMSGRWEYDVYPKTPFTKGQAASGKLVSGTWYTRNKPFMKLEVASKNLKVVTAAYNDVQSRLGKIGFYHLLGLPSSCRTEAERLINRALRVAQQ